MHLLDTTEFSLRSFVADNAPPYAILSHRWEAEEVTYQDLQAGRGPSMAGWRKITQCCAQARKDGHEYVWIDTCCIDKLSSAELSEAINSMFRWFEGSEVCYTYLNDVTTGGQDQDLWVEEFKRSEWFTRGWTLQELIAPYRMDFYDAEWSKIGSREYLGSMIESVTGVEREDCNSTDEKSVQHGGHYFTRSVAQRMCWASTRITTRAEDVAYCLMGIFDVNMPLLYGEGGRKAFYRLQIEIMAQSDDETLFAWNPPSDQAEESPFSCQHWEECEGSRICTRWHKSGMLARSVQQFRGCELIVPQQRKFKIRRRPYSMSNKGLLFDMVDYDDCRDPGRPGNRLVIVPLSCRRLGSLQGLAVRLLAHNYDWVVDRGYPSDRFCRYGPLQPIGQFKPCTGKTQSIMVPQNPNSSRILGAFNHHWEPTPEFTAEIWKSQNSGV